MIGREDFRAYSDAVAAIADEAARAVEERVLAWLGGNPGATAAQAREAAKAIMAEVAPAYDEAAASLAAEWYDEQAEAAHAKLPSAVTETTYDAGTADTTARYQVRKFEAGDFEGFARACGAFAANDAKRTVNATVMANAGRDRSEGVRFARVATGVETCSFCLMLASRGAVYCTRQTAGEFNHFHLHCDCKVVPGFEDDPMAVLVEGFDPQGLYDRLKLVEKQTGLKLGAAGDMAAFDRELKLRDAEWLMYGTSPTITKDDGAVPLQKELVAAGWLVSSGFSVHFRKTRSSDGLRTSDILIGGSNGVPWELKTACRKRKADPLSPIRGSVWPEFEGDYRHIED